MLIETEIDIDVGVRAWVSADVDVEAADEHVPRD